MILLDMDGVLCDFVGEACELHGRDPATVTRWDFYAGWGMTAADFWRPINHQGRDFWARLQPYPWAAELIEAVAKADPDFHVCTTPSASPESLAGKLDWLHAHFGRRFRRYHMTPSKAALAAPGRLLIDDSDHNVGDFIANGGEAMLFPQPWNRFATIARERMNGTRYVLARYAIRRARLEKKSPALDLISEAASDNVGA